MSETNKNGAARAMRLRRLVVRSALVAAYVAVGVWVMLSGREHIILLDNKTLADGSAQAFRRVKVIIDRNKPIELYARDRDKITVRGQRHTIRLETTEEAKTLEAGFSVDFSEDMFLLSVPAMASGRRDFIELFKTAPEPPKDAATGGDEVPAPTF